MLLSYADEGVSVRRNGSIKTGTSFPCTATGTYYENCNGDEIFIDNQYHDSDRLADRYKDIIRWKTIGQLIVENDIR